MNQENIGKQIVRERKRLNYTQKQLADKIGVSDKTISKWERGAGCPDISLLLPLCTELNIDVSQLLGKEQSDAGKTDKDEGYLTQEQQVWKHISEYAKIKIVENKSRFLKTTLIGLLLLGLLAIVITFIVNYALEEKISWAMIVCASIIYGYCILFVLLVSARRKIMYAQLTASVGVFPFLYVLSQQIVYDGFLSLAYSIAAGGVVLSWLVYFTMSRVTINIWYRYGIIVIYALVFSTMVNSLLHESNTVLFAQGALNFIGALVLFTIGWTRKRMG